MTAAQIDHTWRRLYRAESCDQRMLPMKARWLRDHFIRYPAGIDGFICHTEDVMEDLCYLLGARNEDDRNDVRYAAGVLLDEGYLVHENGELFIRNFEEYQGTPKSRKAGDAGTGPMSGAERARRFREKKKAEKSVVEEDASREPVTEERYASRYENGNVTPTKEEKREEGEGEKSVASRTQRDDETPPPVSMVTPVRGGVRSKTETALEALDPRRSVEWPSNLVALRQDLEVMWDGWRKFLAKPGLPFPTRRETLEPLLGLIADGRQAAEVAELMREAHPDCWHKRNGATLPQVCRNIDGLGVPASGVTPSNQKPTVTYAQGGL